MGSSFRLFECYGIELEFMIVKKDDLSVFPVCDRILQSVAGKITNEVSLGEIAWSNELVLHVIELKTNGPSKDIASLPQLFHKNIEQINSILSPMGGMLMPSGAHPFMDPHKEVLLWPHENDEIYSAYNRIFNCTGHGWSNLQSIHVNLPFQGDEEFARLHTALRLVLPLIPGLCASTPVIDGKITGLLDTRLNFYKNNQKKIPSIAGCIVPETILSKKEYEEKILQKIYSDISPYDKEKLLQEEWLNSRGAIARFERNAIEVRLPDIQECPAADIAVAGLIAETAKALVQEKWSTYEEQKSWHESTLSLLLDEAISKGEQAFIRDSDLLRVFGFQGKAPCSIQKLWAHIMKDTIADGTAWASPLKVIQEQGTLARRIITHLKDNTSKENILKIYKELSTCLAEGKMFEI